MTLKPWRDLIVPHKDVLEGTFQESEFAADMNKVAKGTSSPEYQDPLLFFQRTYITEGMGLLLESVAKRLCGKGGDPVVQLQTSFGGGKTHAMIAVYHLAKGQHPPKDLSGIPPLLDRAAITDLPKAHVAVLDGNALSISHPRKHKNTTINTLWGEIAWQLGGENAYKIIEKSDKDGTSPGKDLLAKLFQNYAPCIILMDETVAYTRQFEDGKSYPGGTFDSNMSFLQALTESASQVPTTMVLASLPQSGMEVGGPRGKYTLKQLEKLFSRIESIWKPVATEEGFEIVRRRLFAPLTDTAARDAVCSSFADCYRNNQDFPGETQEARYNQRLTAAYPFHPEIFDRLYEDWATHENFQRTRGVLRLMAMVIHRLWSDGNSDLMILPGSLPLYDTQVRSELLRYLPQGWEPVVERDVDGPRAITTEIDQKHPTFGKFHAARRVARTVFLGSAPSIDTQNIRGINLLRIRLGCVQPNQHFGNFDDALRRLTDQLHYLYSEKDRYWYNTQTNLRREVEDRMSRFDRDEHILPELHERLRKLYKGYPFKGVHIFTNHEDIPDDTYIRLIILPPTAYHKWKGPDSPAIQTATQIQANRGNQPRINQNRLIYIAVDIKTVDNLYDQTKRFLAWDSILSDKKTLNLDQHRTDEAEKNMKEHNAKLTEFITKSYYWVLAPYQEPLSVNGTPEVKWEEQRLPHSDGNPMDNLKPVLSREEILIFDWDPFHLKTQLDNWYWKDNRVDYPIKTLWDDFCRYTYLPRLLDISVLKNTIEKGIESREYYAFASGKVNDGYGGFKFGTATMIYAGETALIIQRDAAAAYEDELKQEKTKPEVKKPEIVRKTHTVLEPGEISGDVIEQKERMHSFYGTVKLDPENAPLEFSKILEEIIQHFSSNIETAVTIKLDIDASSPRGFDETLCRTVKENANTLRFNEAEFDEKK